MVAVVGVLVLVLPAALRSVDQQLTALPGVGMLSAACLAVLTAALRQHHGTLWRVGIAALTLAGVVVMVFHEPDPAPMTAWWPLQIVWLVGAYLALTAHSTAGVVVVSIGVLGIFTSASPVPAGLADTAPTRYLILTGVVAATSNLTLGLVARSVVDVLRAGERQAAVNRRQVLEAAEERIGLRARTLATRHIHDHVLYTLQLIAMDRRDVPARDVLAEVSRLRGRLRERGTEMPVGADATTTVGFAVWLAAQRIEEQADLVDRALIWSQEAAAVEQAAWDQVTRVSRSVPGDPLSLLAGLDDGRLDAADPKVRAQACLCERGLRAEITATAHVDLSTSLQT